MVRENSWDEYMDMARSLLRLDERMWRSMSDEYRDMAIEWNLEVEVRWAFTSTSKRLLTFLSFAGFPSGSSCCRLL